MKKLCLLLLFLCGLEMYAQKQYVTIYADPVTLKSNTQYSQVLTGAVSDFFVQKVNELKSRFNVYIYDERRQYGTVSVSGFPLGETLNILGAEGYEIDQTLLVDARVTIFMSRAYSDGTANVRKAKKGDVNEDEKVDISDVVSVVNIIAKE